MPLPIRVSSVFHPWLLFLLAAAIPAAADENKPDPKMEFDPAHAEKMREGIDLFKGKVRQILVKSCVECHGGPEVESGLDLATRKGLLRGGSKGPAVVAGKSRDSNMWRFIAHKEDPKMPDGAEKLPEDQIAAVAKWIDLGAPYDSPLVPNPRDPDRWTNTVIKDDARNFWSYQPLVRRNPPAVKNAAWVRSPIDAFVLAKLEEKGLTPNGPVEKRILIRRAYFDLIGLPPTAEEVEGFVNDKDPEAYAKVLDKLLDNPHYGERWGRHWLDAARFAESHGFEQDYDRPYAFHFRDFVIKALNQDMPYNQFVRWQLAGDEIAPDNPLAMMATGFLGAGVFPTQITANEVERSRYDAIDDMAATTSNAMLGFSIGCARCHDHKFDPIPQADYYRFVSTFTTTVRSNLDINMDPAPYLAAKAVWDKDHAPLAEALAKFEREQLPSRLVEWEKTAAADYRAKNKWVILDVAEMKSAGGATLTKQPDGSILATEKNPDFDTYTFTTKTSLRGITGIRLEALSHPSLAKGGPGRAENGNIDLTNFVVKVKPNAGGEEKTVKLQNPQATFEQPTLFIKNAIDEDKKSGWAVDPQFGKDHAAVFETAEELGAESGVTLTFTLEFNGNNKHNIGRPRLSVTTTPKPLTLDAGGIPANVAAVLDTPADKRTPEQSAAILKWYGTLDAEWQKVNQPVQDHLAKAPKPNMTQVMVCSEGVTPIRHHTQGGDFLNETHFLKRGDCDQKMGVATQSFPQVLMTAPEKEKKWIVAPPPGSKTSFRRTSMANWITDTEQGAGHLLARVMANRLWQHHFGRGIVGTPNDFGVQGERPTHPELLDYLATELIASGWKLKAMHKQLMLTSTYMQSSQFDEADAKIDPENTWLWRHTPRRMEAEIVRDNLLAVSGTLDPTMFGPGSLEETHKRRSIYFMIKRSKLIPMMQLFDQPEPLVSVGGRPSTTIAPQALMFMNNPQVRLYAHNFAKKLLPVYEKSPADAIKQGYLTAVARQPDDGELTDAIAFLESQQKSYLSLPDKQAQAKELALADFCQVLFGLNEFVYVE
jgi:mono/diheme cytochrome c family protein